MFPIFQTEISYKLYKNEGNVKRTVLSLLLLSAYSFAEIPTYSTGYRILQFNGAPMNTEYGHNSPCVVDWNEDGKKDLIVGEFKSAKMKYYENIGENSAPVFGEGVYLQADGKDIVVEKG